MDPKILTESNWKATVAKFKVKDNGLQKALATYEKLDESKFDDRLKAAVSISQLAGTLKKDKAVAAMAPVVKYLTDVGTAADAEKSEITKAKAAAAATAKKAQDAAKKDAEKEKESDEEEDESGDALTKLTTALKNLKTAKQPYFFLVCDAKPYGLVVSKKEIKTNAQAKKELAQMAGGSTRPPKFGTCHFDSGKLVFDMEKPPNGLARILQKWIKDNTGLALKVMVGTESAEDEEKGPEAAAEADAGKAAEPKKEEGGGVAKDKVEEEPIGAKGGAAEAPAKDKKALEAKRNAFKKARATWVAVKKKAEADIEKVKAGAKMHYINDPDQYPKVVKGCQAIDGILDNLDDSLRDTLDEYASAPLTNQAKLHALSAEAEKVLDKFYKYVSEDPLMKAIDMKEFADVTVHAPVLKALDDLRKALS